MSETTQGMPEDLRQAVAADIKPVRPMAAPWKRVLLALPLVALLFSAALLYFGLRPGLDNIGLTLSWVPVGLQVIMALALLALALRDAIPGMRVSRGVVVGLAVGALGFHVAVNLLIWLRYPMGAENFLEIWWDCFRYEFLLGVPVLVAITWLASTALPVRPRTIGLLAGIGAGVMSEAGWRMVCPVSHPYHVFSAHGGAILLLGSLGFLVGMLWEQRRAASGS